MRLPTSSAILSLIPPSIISKVGSIILLIGLSGEIAILVVTLSQRVLENRLAITFAVLVFIGVWLEYIAYKPRTLDKIAQRRLTEAIKGFSGTPFDFSVALDPEAVSLMELIANALTTAGWNRQAVASGIGFAHPGKHLAGIVVFAGLEIQITQSRQSQWGMDGQAAKVLWHALQKEGLTTKAKVLPEGQEIPNAIHIKIGSKP